MMSTSPEVAAAAAALYLDLDPAFFIEQSAMYGAVVFTDGKLLHCGLLDGAPDDRERDRIVFLWSLMKLSGAGKAVRELLIKRGLQCQRDCHSSAGEG